MTIKYRSRPAEYKGGTAANITFVVTDACQLRCRYCYLHSKGAHSTMSLSLGRKVADYILENERLWPGAGVVFDFIGGEPLLEIELIDALSDYLKKQMFVRDHPWFDNYRLSISTNGLLYGDPRVQRYIAKNHDHLNISISLDGTREKHDRQRVFPDGSGSHSLVEEAFKLYISQFPDGSTKATVGHEDLPLVAQSVLYLFSLGVGYVDINVVFEDVWQEGDAALFEEQLMILADAMVDQRLFERHSCSFFVQSLGSPLDPLNENGNWCGTGRMMAVDQRGNFYPCNRFMANALSCGKPRTIGNIETGMDENLRRPFLMLSRSTQSPAGCMTCEVASGCAWCPGQSYDACGGESIYRRATANCAFHKATVRAKNYYWSRVRGVTGEG